MAIARLSLVILVCPRSELGPFLSKVRTTGIFHPSDRKGLVQDLQLVLLSSRAHAVYSEANALLHRSHAGVTPEAGTFTSDSVVDLVAQLSNELKEVSQELRNGLDPGKVEDLYADLIGIRDAALSVFKDVSRVRVYPGLRRVIIIEGFVPTDRLRDFRVILGHYILSTKPVPRRQPGVPYVPSLLVNPKIVDLFEGVTLSLGVPKYNEVDPTPIVALAFPVFFGIMFSDTGRGLVLFAAGLLLRNRSKESYRYLGRLLLVLGASATLVGLLRGVFFGVALPYLAPLPSPSFLTQGPSLRSSTFWLELGIVIGTIHLASGYVLAITNHVLSKDYARAFLSYMPTLVLYASTIPFVFALVGVGLNWNALFTSQAPTLFFSDLLGVQVPPSLVVMFTLPAMLFSLAVLVFGRVVAAAYFDRRNTHALALIEQGVVEALVRPAELFIHTVSYIRLGILLLVGSVLGELLGGLFAFGPVGVALAVPGNLAVIAIEALIVYVQDLRLNVYEWFSKFYSGVGKPFVPLVSSGNTFTVVPSPRPAK